MRGFVLRRLLYSVITLFLLSLTIFTLVHLMGDPARLLAGPGAAREDVGALRERLGLNRSWPLQYADFAAHIVRGDFGTSFSFRVPVRELYFERLPNSLELAAAAMFISLAIGVPAGIISAVKAGTWWDTASKVFGLLGMSVPNFFIGLVLIILLAVQLGVVPTSGSGSPEQLIMPAIALGWYFAASMLRLIRSSMLDVLGSDYIKLAHLKGLPPRVVIFKHAFRNALIPVLTLAGINFVIMVNAAVVVEVIFAWPGVGHLLYEGISQRDFPLVQGVVLMGGVMIVLTNLGVDLLYAWVDPRIRVTR